MHLLQVWCLVVTATTTVLAAQEWWKTAIFYQIYPRSFKDSDNDGVGDIKGITSKVDYLASLGVNAVWLSPIYKSPMADFGYDISNFTDIDPLFGNMADLLELIQTLKNKGIHIIMDFVPNHSSDEHPWFKMSENRQGQYSEYYVWRNKSGDNTDGTPIEPNNWQSVFSGSAWTWSDVRKQFYLHQFLDKQPDINYRNPLVVQDMKDTVQFWLDKGVDGFRVDAVAHLIEDDNFLNETLIDENSPLSYNNLNHTYTFNQKETFDIITGWSELFREQIAKDGRDRIMFLEVYTTIQMSMKYYGNSSYPFQMPFNFYLLRAINQGMSAKDLVSNCKEWLDSVPAGYASNWVVGNHDNSRVANRAGLEMADSVNMILAMLPGIMITYNGDELGMTDTFLRFEETVDPSGTLLGPDNYESGSRDPERTPLQWDDTENAGFCSVKPWLPANPNYWRLNVATQTSAASSHLKVYQSLSKLRQSDTFLSSTTASEITAPTNYTLSIKRWSAEGETYVLLVNFGSAEVTTNLTLTNVTQMVVNVSSLNAGYSAGDMVTLSAGVNLRPKASIVLKTASSATSIASMTNTLAMLLVSLSYVCNIMLTLG